MFDTTDNEGFQRQLSRVAEAKREQARLLDRRQAILADLETAARQIEARRTELVKEHEDVVRLESFSLSRVVTSLRGEHDDKLRKEQAERETARLALLAAEEHEREAVRDLQAVNDRIASLGDVDGEWDRVIDARERWVEATSTQLRTRTAEDWDGASEAAGALTRPDAESLAALIEHRAILESHLREVDEALASAHLAAAKLAHTAAVIGSGQSWSAYESWFGGGLPGSMYDDDKLDAAATALREVDGVLALLRRELDDLARHGIIQVDIDAWDRTFDAFLDEFFNDLSIDRRVKAAAQKVSELRAEISRVISLVGIRGQTLIAEASDLVAKRDDLIR